MPFLYLSDPKFVHRHYLWFEIDVKSHMKRMFQKIEIKGYLSQICLNVVWTFSSSMFFILYEGFTELSNYTCQVLFQKRSNAFQHFFNLPPPHPKNQSMLLEWQQWKKKIRKKKKKNCGKRKNESDWTGIEVSWREDGFLCSQWKAVITLLSSCSGSS